MTTMSVLLSEFTAEYLGLYRIDRRPRTVSKMTQLLTELCLSLGAEATTAELTTAGIGRWKALYGPPRSPWTVFGQLGYLRAACSYAAEEGLVSRPPNWKRLLPKRPKLLGKRHLSRAELVKLLTFLELEAAGGDWKAVRLYALVATAIYTGLRRDELLWLRLADMHAAEGYLEVVPHAERELKTTPSARYVGLSPELVPIIKRWLPEAGPVYLWPGVTRRGPWRDGRKGCRPIDALGDAAELAEIPCRPTWQSLRRSWATHADFWGVTESQRSSNLGHSGPETARRHYLCLDVDNLRAIAARIRLAS